MFEVKVKPGHPTGIRNRDGKTFTANGVVRLRKVSDAIKNDPWLIVTEAEDEKKQEK